MHGITECLVSSHVSVSTFHHTAFLCCLWLCSQGSLCYLFLSFLAYDERGFSFFINLMKCCVCWFPTFFLEFVDAIFFFPQKKNLLLKLEPLFGLWEISNHSLTRDSGKTSTSDSYLMEQTTFFFLLLFLEKVKFCFCVYQLWLMRMIFHVK